MLKANGSVKLAENSNEIQTRLVEAKPSNRWSIGSGDHHEPSSGAQSLGGHKNT